MSTKSIPCPICKNSVEVGAEDFPFCSERCRTIDLGKWASGEYKIASPVFDEELLDELERAQQQQAKTSDDEWKN